MRILLMLPYDPSFTREGPDLGLGYLAACLQRDGHTVQICLGPRKFASPSAFSDFVRQARFDLFGIKVMACSLMATRETIRLIRDVDPKATIILGGPHVSGAPHRIFDLLPEADYAFHGESEIGLVEFVNKFSSARIPDSELGKIPNLVWRKGSQTIVNDREFVIDLDTLPFPAWDLMKPNEFPQIPHFNGYVRKYPMAPIVLTRGCPNRCTYCGAELINGRRIRSRSVENVMEEIELLTTQFGVREIHLYDSNCAHPRAPLRQVCERIIANKIDIVWNAPNGIRLDSIDKDLAVLMRQSGCYQVSVGIESGSPRILEQIRKGLSLDTVRENVSILREAGIEVIGLFMLGFPGETAAEIKQTISLAMDLPLTAASFAILCPLPGTEIYAQVFGDRDLDIDVLNSLDFTSYKNNLSQVPANQLRRIQKKAYWRFHLRPHIIKYFLGNISNLQAIPYLISRIYVNALR